MSPIAGGKPPAPRPKIIGLAIGGAALVLTGIGIWAGVAQARSRPDPQKLIAQWREQNTLCRGLHGDDPRTQPACDERQRLGRALYHRGWCYGEIDQIAYQMQWHRCHENSLPHD